MADDLLVTDEVLEDPLVLRRLLSDIIERLGNDVNEINQTEIINRSITVIQQTGVPLAIQDEGIELTSQVVQMNFIGNGVTVTEPNVNETEINIPKSGWQLISTLPQPVGASFVRTWDPTLYREIKFILEDITVDTDANQIQIQVGHTNGTTILTGANYNNVFNSGQSTWTNSTGQTFLNMTPSGSMGNDVGEYFSGHILVQNFRSANSTVSIEARNNYKSTIASPLDAFILGRFLGADHIIDTLKFMVASGNFSGTGSIEMWGLPS